jgi:hypothetical protein
MIVADPSGFTETLGTQNVYYCVSAARPPQFL